MLYLVSLGHGRPYPNFSYKTALDVVAYGSTDKLCVAYEVQ